jgi:glyoxylase-like metal-dependent hydrolase (beta-lactamase superfamily II)
VLISARDARLLKKDLSLDEGEEGKLKGMLPGAKTEPTRTVGEGDVVGSLQVVPSPGHTPGHVAFLDPRDGTLYCGDVFVSWGGLIATSAAFNWRFPLALGGTWNRPLDVESARKLRALEPKALAPGHGKVIENPGAGMDKAIAKAARS